MNEDMELRAIDGLDVTPEERAEIRSGVLAALQLTAQYLLAELDLAPPDRKNFVRTVFTTKDGALFSLVLQREGAKTPLDLAGERDAAIARADRAERVLMFLRIVIVRLRRNARPDQQVHRNDCLCVGCCAAGALETAEKEVAR